MSPGHAAPKQKWTPKLTRYIPSISILSPSSFSHHITVILWTFCIDLLPTVCQTSQMFSMRLIAYLKEPTGGWRVFLGTFWEGPFTLNPWVHWLFFPRDALSWKEHRCQYPLLAFSGFSRSVKLLLPWLKYGTNRKRWPSPGYLRLEKLWLDFFSVQLYLLACFVGHAGGWTQSLAPATKNTTSYHYISLSLQSVLTHLFTVRAPERPWVP